MTDICLVCDAVNSFDNSNDEDCLRCNECLSLRYVELNSIVLGHRMLHLQQKYNPLCKTI